MSSLRWFLFSSLRLGMMSSVTVLETMQVKVQLGCAAPFFSQTHALFLPLQNIVQYFSVKIDKIPSDFTHSSSALLPERENILSGTITFFFHRCFATVSVLQICVLVNSRRCNRNGFVEQLVFYLP